MSPIILIGAGVLLLGLGMGLGYLVAINQRNREASKANDIQKELNDYRQQVTAHFGQTAQHFHTIGQEYQSLYKHMVSGADTLCDATQSDALLGFAAGNVASIADRVAEPDESPPEVIRDYVADEIDSAPVTAESVADENPQQEESPTIRDYAVEEASDTDIEVSATERTEAVEPTPDLAAAGDETSADDVISETVSDTTVIESERTVH